MTQTMNPEVKTLWLEALRSGDYKQATGALNRMGVGQCCLGILCEVAVAQGFPLLVEAVEPYNGEQRVMYNQELGLLPPEVRAWAGVDSCASGRLIEMNDDLKKNFSEIADWIEANL